MKTLFGRRCNMCIPIS